MSVDFAIEWVYGDLRIARLRGGEVVEQWQSAERVSDLASLGSALREASAHVAIGRGGSVAIAYEDDLHTHEFLEIPPMSRRDRTRFLQRHVDTHKQFEGAAAWRAHEVDRVGAKGVLLHIMPRAILDAILRICSDFYLVPKLLVPLSEIMSSIVPTLDGEADGPLLMVALFEERTQMLVSSAAGDILFVRELSYPWTAETSGRLVVDINRTIGYAKQRLGGAVAQTWVFGQRADMTRIALDSRIDAPVDCSERATEPEFWMQRVAVLPERLSSNFIPLLARRSVTGKTMMRAGLLVTAVATLAAVVVAGIVELALFRNRIDVIALQQQLRDRQEAVLSLEAEATRMSAEARKLDMLNVDAFNLPGLFLSKLPTLVPEGVVLTEVDVQREQSGWSVALLGLTDVSLEEAAPLLADLQDALTASPWNATVTQSWEDAWMRQLETGRAASDDGIGFELRVALQ